MVKLFIGLLIAFIGFRCGFHEVVFAVALSSNTLYTNICRRIDDDWTFLSLFIIYTRIYLESM